MEYLLQMYTGKTPFGSMKSTNASWDEIIKHICVCLLFRRAREFQTHAETPPLPVKGCFDLYLALARIKPSVTSVYKGHLRGPMTLTPVAERLAVQRPKAFCLNILTNCMVFVFTLLFKYSFLQHKINLIFSILSKAYDWNWATLILHVIFAYDTSAFNSITKSINLEL